ncbi:MULTISPECIES: alkane 1-monooxygenase [Pseudomonadaceae]|jgi:alkane 1-monooxygenase|uniref:Alkane 1-monooxygenase n=2 Tax=Aquipseudomonas alcaligenes TaxID=43263 RepID=A0AA42ST67_AQUAC|nr:MULTISPECIES: alkane 1-monooxygenase [Pseudomonas]MDC7824284.1 alkane 1-monooxygenase [Pseudomonas sp. BLCC-B13]MDH0144109.1 alkane 1-monooxygenase [Pseudomonas alcaligenes]MDH1055574.1 alkane 1-monooxygenase [Pseudomonas alcaligenes]MEE1947681.1 alkane 1-monooxygenase [Pseudomonas alcaligenes]NMY43177.1 alkane 1-monooxygenase [Pseudomonas sp. WS 5013]
MEIALPYRDHKRPLWLLSLFVPILGLIGPALYLLVSPSEFWLWLSPLFFYFGIPLLDALIGEDPSNPPESEVPALEADPYYRWITYLLVPVLWASFIAICVFVASQPLSATGLLAMIINTGGGLGFAINLGHEMGHKKSTLERWLAKLALAPACYGHFYIEHNRGHHRDVATPVDPASSRMGESIYRFVLREMPGGFRRAWQLERERLARCGKSPWSLDNEVLQPALISLALYGALVAALGWQILPFLLLSAFWGAFQLTSANYLEHYGLLRRKLENGRYEVCQPHHSWNSNHLFSNWALFHLQRHSDHHAHPTRRYQSLRNFPDLPRLPSGYFGMYLLAYVPPLWFRLMNPRLIAAVQGDAARINFQPGLRERLMRRYGLQEHAA